MMKGGGTWLPGYTAVKKSIKTGLRLAGLTNNVPLFFDVNTGQLVIDVHFQKQGLQSIKAYDANGLQAQIKTFLSKNVGEKIRGYQADEAAAKAAPAAPAPPVVTSQPSAGQKTLSMFGFTPKPSTRRNRQDRRRTRRNRRS